MIDFSKYPETMDIPSKLELISASRCNVWLYRLAESARLGNMEDMAQARAIVEEEAQQGGKT